MPEPTTLRFQLESRFRTEVPAAGGFPRLAFANYLVRWLISRVALMTNNAGKGKTKPPISEYNEAGQNLRQTEKTEIARQVQEEFARGNRATRRGGREGNPDTVVV